MSEIKVEAACEIAQKNAIRKALNGNTFNTKEKILSYWDLCPFYSKDVIQNTYKDLTGFLNRESKKGRLLRVSTGKGSWASYTFPKEHLEKLINEVLDE
jgi:hypothetical protein